VDECPVCGATVPVARQFQHKRWHAEQDERTQALEDRVQRHERDLTALLRRFVRRQEHHDS
jgi:hypothetical protein